MLKIAMQIKRLFAIIQICMTLKNDARMAFFSGR
jgi:hypothetical protein